VSSIHARIALALLVAIVVTPALAARVYRWTDSRGVVHYGDRAAEGAAAGVEVTAVPVYVEPRPTARLRIVPEDRRNEAWADNLIDGPIEVLLHAEPGTSVTAVPALPARAGVPARSSVLVAYVVAGSAPSGVSRLHLQVVPGDPRARPRDVEYGYPLQSQALRIEQGWGGHHSHADVENRYAVDFAAPVGTAVLAAREGRVMQLESDFHETGHDSGSDGARANYVRILHDDGSMAVYAHLQADGVLVRSGQQVRRGQQIGWSGNTGYSGGPHLHFVVQVNRGMKLESIPFKMFGPQGILRMAEPRAGGQ
jgi:hypothetical protein